MEGDYQDFYLSSGDTQTIVAKATSTTTDLTISITWIELGT